MAEHKLRALVSGLTPWFFNKTKDNTIEGHTYPDEASALDIGSATKPFRAIYADSLLGSGGGSIDQLVKVSAADSASGYLEDKIAGVAPISLATSTDSLINITLDTSTLLLRSGVNSLTGNLSVGSGVTIDGVDLGSPGNGIEIVSNAYAVDLHANAGLDFSSGELFVNDGTTLVRSGNVLNVDLTASFNWTVGTHTFNTTPQLAANLNFTGSSPSITAAGDLTIDPTGNLYYALAQDISAVGFQDLVSGIRGFKHNNPEGNTRQLTIGRIKADELYVRVFTADEERVNRGAEFWARSYGIVETTFEVPADEANVDVYFEEVPGLPGAKLFLPSNWILFRTVDIDTGLTVMKAWFQVVDAGANDYVSRADADEPTGRLAYQVWRLKHKSGGLPGAEIKKGNVGVDFGIPADFAGTPAIGQFEGQGVVALSALSQDSGPYIQIQTFETVTTDEPNFLNRVRMGNLNGILGYDREVDGELFGFAAGNDLSHDVDSGDFAGIVIDQINGLRMYNTNIKLFSGADDVLYVNPDLGIGFQVDNAGTEATSNQLYISWYSDLADSGTYASPIGRIGTWGTETNRAFSLRSFGSETSRIALTAIGDNGIPADSLASLQVIAGGSVVSRINLDAYDVRILTNSPGDQGRLLVGATNDSIVPVSRFHVYDDNDAIGESGGIIIEQAGTGDPMLHWLLTGGQYFTAGIDQTDGKWKLTANNFLMGVTPSIIIDPSDGKVTINGLDLSSGDPISGLTSSDSSITIVASDIIVNSAMYVPSTRVVATGSGLLGGGNLSANLSLSVDFTSVVATTTSIVSGNGLTGGGTLATTRTLVVGAGAGITVNPDDVQINFGYSPTWTGVHTFDQDIQVNANLDFIGGNRIITGSNSITMQPGNDLIFTPGDDVILTTSKIFKSSDYSTSSAGVVGFAFITNGAGNKQLDIDTIRVDQLRAQTFVAEATRVEIGDEYWGKSMGVLHDNFTTPGSIGGTVSVYFEDSPAFSGALFASSDWILFRTLTAAGAANEFWGQVTSYAHQGNDADGRGYQRWTFTLRSGAISTVIKRGNIAVGFGAAGQGYVHLTTLTSKNGPWIGIGQWGGSNPYDGVSDTMNVRMGNLNGSAGIAVNDWGFVTGNNISLTPTTGFSGIVSSATDGVLIYNSDLIIYDSGVEVTSLTQSLGLTLTLADSLSHGDGSGQPSTINWINADDNSAWISSGLESSTHTIMDIATFNNDSLGTSEIRISSYGHGGDIIGFPLLSNSHSNIRVSSDEDGYIFLGAMKTITHGSLSVGLPVSPDVQGTLTVPSTAVATLYVNAATSGPGYFDTSYPGVLINNGELRFEVGGSTYVTLGIDESDGDKFIMSYADDFATAFITFDPVTGVTTIVGLDGTAALDGVTAGTGITIAGASIAVNSTVVRTDRELVAGYGLSGGGDLSLDRSFLIDTDVVVVTTRTLTAGNGLTGGGDLTADRTFNVGAGDGITVNANDIAVDSSVARSTVVLTAGAGLTGGGDLTTSRSFAIGGGAGITVNADDIEVHLNATSGLEISSGLRIADSVAGAGLIIASKILAIGAGSGITVNADDIAVDSTVVRTSRSIISGAGLTGGGDLSADRTLVVGAGAGITVNADDVQINLATNSGLNIGAGLAVDASIAGAALTLTAGVLDVIVTSTGGLEIVTDSLKIKLPANSGLTTDATGLYLPSSLAGTGLALTAGVLSVNVTDGLTTSGDNIILASSAAGAGLAYATGILSVNTASGLAISGDNVILASSAAGAGLLYTSGVIDIVAANTSITVNTDSINVNLAHTFAWTGSHTWSTGVFTFNTDPQISGDIDFIGGGRSLTTPAASGYNIGLKPDGDLVLDPTGNITMPNAQEFKTSTFTDAVTGIVGFRMWDRGSNYRQLTTGAIKVDELFARVFVADETRIDRGEEYWSKSYGVVDVDFALPADEASVDVWFENATGIGTGNIFSAGDYLLFRAIDWDTGIAVVKVWFTVTSLLTAGSVDGFTQQWRLKRESGGTTGLVIKKGNVALDVGQIGQGNIHLSALDQDGGPFIQIGEFTSVVSSDTPLFTNYVRMGNLNGTVDYVADTWGFVAGKNIGTSIAGGFSGLTLEATNGLRLFNTEFVLYESGTKIASFGEDTGIVFKYEANTFTNPTRGLYWTSGTPNTLTNTTAIQAYRDVNGNHLGISTANAGGAEINIFASNSSSGSDGHLYMDDAEIYLGIDDLGDIYINAAGNTQIGRIPVGGTATDSRLHLFENTVTNNAATGFTIENAHATGDSMIHFLHGAGTTQRWVLGVDRSDSNKFKISETAGFGSLNHLTITPSTGLINTSGALTVAGVLTVNSTMTLTGALTASAAITMASGHTLTTETIKAVDTDGIIFKVSGGTTYMTLLNTGVLDLDGGLGVAGAVDFDTTLNVDGVATFQSNVVLSMGTQNYEISSTSGSLNIASETSGSPGDFRLFSNDGDGTDNTTLSIWGVGTAANVTNRERLQMMWNSSTSTYDILSEANGTGTLRPLVLFTEGNPNQLYLNILGKVGINTSGSANSFALSVAAPGVTPEASSTISGNAGVVGVFGDGHSFFMARDVTNNREAIFGTSGAGGIVGTLTAHTFTIRTSNADRLTFAAASNDAEFSGVVTATGINVGEDTLSVFNSSVTSFTPAISSAATAPTIGYSSQNGIYTRINNTINFQARIVTTTISGGTAGNTYRLSLPVAGYATAEQVVTLLYRIGTGNPFRVAIGVIPASAAYINVYPDSTLAARTNADLGTNMAFYYGGSYFV